MYKRFLYVRTVLSKINSLIDDSSLLMILIETVLPQQMKVIFSRFTTEARDHARYFSKKITSKWTVRALTRFTVS